MDAAARRPDDLFADTRMSFGDHLEELRRRLWKALAGVGVCLCAGFVLDAVGYALGRPEVGVGYPVMRALTEPAQERAREFYRRRNAEARERLLHALRAGDPELLRPEPMPVGLPARPLAEHFGLRPRDPGAERIEVVITVYPGFIEVLQKDGEDLLNTRGFMRSLSPQEVLWSYVKVSLVSGLVLAGPWVLWQFWAFVGPGLYPHEKRPVYVYFPASVLLFAAGVVLCQLFVLPAALDTLLGFNAWFGIDPDLRLSEWLGFAVVLPLVFGIAFQAPLVMVALARLGVMTADGFARHWRGAVAGMALFAALLTPTTDAVTFLHLFVPLLALYALGIGLCRLLARGEVDEDLLESEAGQVGV